MKIAVSKLTLLIVPFWVFLLSAVTVEGESIRANDGVESESTKSGIHHLQDLWKKSGFGHLDNHPAIRYMQDIMFGGVFSGQSEPDRYRQLTTRPCDTLIEAVPAEQIHRLVQEYLKILTQGNEVLINTTMALVTPNLKYDVGVYKVCGTCAEATAYKNEMDLSFCDPMTYGYDADLSGLAMVPLSASGTPLDGNLRGVLDYHTTVANVNDAPSVQWPSSLKNELDQGAGPALVADILNGLDSLCAASTGAVSMLPDGIGYGETQATHNRSFIVAKYYQQEGYVLWRKTQQWLSTLTNGCTQLQDIASVTGSSEGGLSSIVGADMLHNLGVRILKVYSNAGPINADSVLQFGIESYDQGLISLTKSNIFYQFIVPFSAYSFDNDRLDLPNYGSNQTTISDAYSVQVDQWMSSPDPIPGVQVIGLMPQYGPSILSPDLLNMFQSASAANTYDPCTSQYNIPGETDLICEGILKSDYLDKVNAATYPIEICAGKNDTVIPYDVQFTPEYITGSQVNVLQNLIGAPIQGDHAAVVFQCSINFVNSFAGLAIPTEEDEKPFLITPTAPGVCQTQPPTQAPTLSNVGSTANTTTTTTGPTTSSAWSFLRTDKAAAAMLWLSIIIPFVAVV